MKKIYRVLAFSFFIIPIISSAYINVNLQYGSKGQAVVELQNFLISKGFLTGKATGSFFTQTKKAVIAYQKSQGLPATGYVGSTTRRKINAGTSTKTQTPSNQQNVSTETSTSSQSNSSWINDPTTPMDPVLVQWSNTKKLTWNDFQKTPPSNYQSEAATITTQLTVIPSISHKCDVIAGQNTCTFRLNSFQVSATMDPRLSWVKLSSDFDYVLAHEQVHFDIAELFARKLKSQLNAQINTISTQNTNSSNYILKAYDALYEQKQKAVSAELLSFEKLYDAETDHGRITANQTAWANCVTNWLNSNSLPGNCQMPPSSTQGSNSTNTTQPNTSNNSNFLITSLQSLNTGAVPVVGTSYTGAIGFSTSYDIARSNKIAFSIQGLPSGLSADSYITMNQFSNQGFVGFKGTPTQVGTFTVTVTFTDNNTFNVSKTFNLTVYASPQAYTPTTTTSINQTPAPSTTSTSAPAPTPVASCTPSTNSSTPNSNMNSVGTITVTSPNGGECLTKGTSKTITWSNSTNIDKVTISYMSSTGVNGTIASGIANTGSYTWTVNVGNTTNTQYKIEILGYQTGTGSVSDTSDNFFTVN